MELDEVPEHLLVVGGGYVGVEFGQMFRRFGSQVTIVQRRGQVLTREDPDVAEEISCSSCARVGEVSDPETDQILGAAILGIEGGE